VLDGLHKPIRRTKDGVTLHVYAWRGRGAPKLGEYKADTPAAAHAKAKADSTGIAARYAEATNHTPSAKFIQGLIIEYRSSTDFKDLAISTQRQWRSWLERISEVWGDQPLALMSKPGARRTLIQWRDYYAENSGRRAADYGMQVMTRLLSFAVDREYLAKNPAIGIGRVYQADRSDLIWTEEQIRDACAHAPRHIAEAIELAALTGLRVSDLATLRWDEIGAAEGRKATSKSRGRTSAFIPLTPPLRALLARIERKGDTILVTAHGKPWSAGNTLSKAIQTAAGAAGVDRRTHDLRGTAATRYCLAGLTDSEVAAAMGWEEANVARMRRIYVSAGAVAQSIEKKLNAFTGADSPDAETRA
jgi:integrase